VIDALLAQRVDFVIIGGVALVLHGSARVTRDLDLCYERSPRNLAAMERALAPFRPRLRGAPADLPFQLDAPTLQAGLNFTLETDAGEVDLLGEVTGVGGYAEVARDAVEIDLYGNRVRVMSLDTLERAKRATGRRRDLLDLAEIRLIRERRRG
jgi:predicted nucleotidyltransferase